VADDARLIIDPPGEGAWNMAVDEALLDAAAPGGRPVLRFYQWSEPTLSLGYFQQLAERQSHAASQAADVVRRLSGGGAIVHHRELTYSLIVPPGHRLAHGLQALYDAAHLSLIDTLGGMGAAAEYCPRDSGVAKSEQPFLCFQRRFRGDVLLGDAKIAGSAQRRRGGAVAQHGSILLAASPAAPELLGTAELTGEQIAPQDLLDRWRPALAARLDLAMTTSELTPTERAIASELARDKYGAASWTGRR
jgi:lipoate-protein ligase A